MRAMFLVVASVLLCAGLFGCNRQPEAPAAAPQATVAPAPCNCTLPPATAAPTPVVQTAQTVRQVRRHHRHTLSEIESVAEESYYQENHVTSRANESSSYSSSSETAAQSEAVQMRKTAWVDGYGRAHYASDDAAQDENPARLGAEERHMRRSVWRGWNSRCNERSE